MSSSLWGRRRAALACATFVTVSVALPALAQSNASDYPPACAESKVNARDRDDAHALYVTAKRFLDESAFDKAISLLKDAYTVNCSVHDFLPVIATAYERKGDRKEALRALEEYLARVPSGPEISKEDLQAREKVERRIKNLKDLIAAQAPAPTTSAAPSATVVPTASAAPTVPASAWSPLPVPPQTGGRSALPLVVSGIGVGLLGGGVALFMVGSGQIADTEKACPPPDRKCIGGSAADNVAKGNEGRLFTGLGIGGMALGGAAAIGGLVWYFVQPRKPVEAKAAKVKRLYVTPVVAPSFAGAAAGFSF